MNMLQRPPVEVLAADKRLLAVHQQVFGMQNAAAQPLVRNNPQLQVGDRLQLFQRLRGGDTNPLLFHQKTDFHPALARRFQVLQHAVQQRTLLVRHIELTQIDAGFRRIEHLLPHFGGVAQVIRLQRGFHRRGIHQLVAGNSKTRRRTLAQHQQTATP
ncbi:hypothetical protein D3C79_740380 [compost metagenome]